MFNLDEALRNHLALRQKEPKARFVAATVATLSPRSKPGKPRVVAAVADVATYQQNYYLDDSHHPMVEEEARNSTSPTTRFVFAQLIGPSSLL